MNDRLEKLGRKKRTLKVAQTKFLLEQRNLTVGLREAMAREQLTKSKIDRLRQNINDSSSLREMKNAESCVVSLKDANLNFHQAYSKRRTTQNMKVKLAELKDCFFEVRAEVRKLSKEVERCLFSNRLIQQAMVEVERRIAQIIDVVESETLFEIKPFFDQAKYSAKR